MDIREQAKLYHHDIPNGRVFCTDCGDQIRSSPGCGSVTCPTCNKTGYAEPELDADDSLLSIPDEDGERFYAKVHSRSR